MQCDWFRRNSWCRFSVLFFKFISYLPFLNCAANLPLGLSQQYLVFFPPTYTWFSISSTNLSHFQNLRPYNPLLLCQAHLPTNCFSCHCSNSSHSNFLPPYPVQPVTPLLRSIIMAQCRNAELRTKSIMLLLLFRQFCEWSDIGCTSKRTFCLLNRYVLQCEWFPPAAPTQLQEVLKQKMKIITSVMQSTPNKFCSELRMDWLTVYIFRWYL